ADSHSGLPVGAVEVYDGLQDPGMPIPKEVQQITGITDAMVRGQQLDEARVALMLDGVDLVIAHNAGFDRPFCEARLPQFASLRWACSLVDVNWKALGYGSAKLEQLALQHGWFYDAHRAEVDCHALLAVLGVPLGAQQGNAMQALLAASAQPSYRLQATGAPFEAKDALKARGYRWTPSKKSGTPCWPMPSCCRPSWTGSRQACTRGARHGFGWRNSMPAPSTQPA
ncbi:MAG: hypothetical protein IPO19_22170, partial [Rhodoferax sp.]|nr:hypothetical protein [Rhodoferax sp.]